MSGEIRRQHDVHPESFQCPSVVFVFGGNPIRVGKRFEANPYPESANHGLDTFNDKKQHRRDRPQHSGTGALVHLVPGTRHHY